MDETQGGTIDRFYVMALTDFTANGNTSFCWDKNNQENTFGTSTEFKSGVANTELLINTDEVTWADQDIWKYLNGSDGWFVPSRAEWSAFAQELGITSATYQNYGLTNFYWSSSQPLGDPLFEGCSKINTKN